MLATDRHTNVIVIASHYMGNRQIKQASRSVSVLFSFWRMEHVHLPAPPNHRKSEKQSGQLQPLPRWAKKLVNFGPQTKML